MSFPQESQERLKQIRTLHSDFLRDTADVSEYLKYLSKLKDNKNIECHLAACSAISSAIIYSNITLDLHHFSKCFTYLITCPDEVVRRSCLSLISLLAQKGQLETVLNFMLPLFKEKWTDRAQEMMLSFAFSFIPPAANYFRIFLPTAETLRKSDDELLSSTATDFIIYMNNLDSSDKNGSFNNREPKAVLMLRSSINFSKIHENFFLPDNNNNFDDDFIDDENPLPQPSSIQEPFVTGTDSNFDKKSPSKSKPRTTNSVRRKNRDNDDSNDDNDTPLNDINNSYKPSPKPKKTTPKKIEQEPEPVPPPVQEPNYDEFDENSMPPTGKSLLCNSIDLRKVLGPNFDQNLNENPESKRPPKPNSVDSFDESKLPRPSSKAKQKSKPKSGSSGIPTPTNSPGTSRRSSIKNLNRYNEDREDEFNSYSNENLDDDTNDSKEDDRPTYKKSPKPAKNKRPSNLSNSGSTNTSASGTPTTKRKSGSIPQKDKEKEKEIPISELTTMLRNKDWEMQQKAVDILNDHLTNDPTQLNFLCKDIWLNLIDAVSSPRTMLAHQSFQLAECLYRTFSQTLCAQTSQWIQLLLNSSCSSHQFISEDATDVLNAIAENSPRSRIFSSFVSGLKHKNSIARGKAVLGLMCVIPNCSANANSTVKQTALDDKELKTLIVNIAPLTRDTRVETRDAAKKALKELSTDERFMNLAKTSLSAQDFTDLKKMIV